MRLIRSKQLTYPKNHPNFIRTADLWEEDNISYKFWRYTKRNGVDFIFSEYIDPECPADVVLRNATHKK